MSPARRGLRAPFVTLPRGGRRASAMWPRSAASARIARSASTRVVSGTCSPCTSIPDREPSDRSLADRGLEQASPLQLLQQLAGTELRELADLRANSHV